MTNSQRWISAKSVAYSSNPLLVMFKVSYHGNWQQVLFLPVILYKQEEINVKKEAALMEKRWKLRGFLLAVVMRGLRVVFTDYRCLFT